MIAEQIWMQSEIIKSSGEKKEGKEKWQKGFAQCYSSASQYNANICGAALNFSWFSYIFYTRMQFTTVYFNCVYLRVLPHSRQVLG